MSVGKISSIQPIRGNERTPQKLLAEDAGAQNGIAAGLPYTYGSGSRRRGNLEECGGIARVPYGAVCNSRGR
jgi:hypothetical protein